MIVTLAGENSFALKEELASLIEDFTSQYGELALERLDAGEVELARLSESLTSLPFLSPKKLVVIREGSKNKVFNEAFEILARTVTDDTDVILIEPKLDKRLSFYKFLKSQTDFREFNEADPAKLAPWLVKRASEKGGQLTLADARALVERVGASQELLSHELDKLLLYNPQVSRATIELLTDRTLQSTIFQLLEAAFNSELKRVSVLYKEQRELKIEPLQIMALLVWQLHALAIVKTAGAKDASQLAREAKLNPYVVHKSQAIARRLTLTRLKELTADLLKLDVRLKSSGIDADEALQHYLLSLAT